MGVSVGVAREGVTLIDLVPVDTVVGVFHFVRGDPLVSIGATLSDDTDPLSLDGTAGLNPLISIVPTGDPGLLLRIESGDPCDPGWVQGRERDGESQSDGIAVENFFVLLFCLEGEEGDSNKEQGNKEGLHLKKSLLKAKIFPDQQCGLLQNSLVMSFYQFHCLLPLKVLTFMGILPKFRAFSMIFFILCLQTSGLLSLSSSTNCVDEDSPLLGLFHLMLPNLCICPGRWGKGPSM